MHKLLKLAFALFLLLFVTRIRAGEALFMQCPTVFNSDLSSITVNVYNSSPPTSGCGFQNPGSPPPGRQCNANPLPPNPNQNFLNVSVDGGDDDLFSCACNDTANPGSWNVTVSTAVSRKYNITAQLVRMVGANPTVLAESSCIVKRATFTSNFTVPEIDLTVIPVILMAALIVVRRKKLWGFRKS